MKKNAFTLSEVLITLAIIGVIAAVTLPILTKNYRRHMIGTKLKYTYTIFQQALKLSEIDHGPIEQWEEFGTINGNNQNISKAFADEYFIKYFRGVKPLDRSGKRVYYQLSNGIIIGIWSRGDWGEIAIHTEGLDKSVSGKNYFMLVYSYKPKTAMYSQNQAGIAFYGSNYNINNLKNHQNYGCYNKNANSYGLFCGALIQRNNWIVPDDYPW